MNCHENGPEVPIKQVSTFYGDFGGLSGSIFWIFFGSCKSSRTIFLFAAGPHKTGFRILWGLWGVSRDLFLGVFLIFVNLRRQTSYVKKDAGEGRFWVAEVPIKQVFTFYGDFGGPSGLPPPRQVLVTPPARQLPASEKRRAWNARVDSSI